MRHSDKYRSSYLIWRSWISTFVTLYICDLEANIVRLWGDIWNNKYMRFAKNKAHEANHTTSCLIDWSIYLMIWFTTCRVSLFCDWWTDRPMDRPSCRDTRMHLKMCSSLFRALTGYCLLNNIGFPCFGECVTHGTKDRPNKRRTDISPHSKTRTHLKSKRGAAVGTLPSSATVFL